MKQPITIVIRQDSDSILEATLDGTQVDLYQKQDGQHRTLYDVSIDDLQLIIDVMKNEANSRK